MSFHLGLSEIFLRSVEDVHGWEEEWMQRTKRMVTECPLLPREAPCSDHLVHVVSCGSSAVKRPESPPLQLFVQGTIFPAPNFNPIMDAQMLGGALQGFDCDKDMLIDILTQRCSAQRQMIAEAYQSMYGRDLIGDLKEKLSSHFKDVMVGLMYPPPSFDAHELWHAMKGAGTDENCLIDILASRTNGEIFQMREAYCLQYSSNLQEDIYSETSGHFRDTLLNLLQGSREEGYADPAMAAQDAMVLWEACQQRTGEHKTMLQLILCNKSYQQLWLVFQEFQNISGQDIVDAINDCYDGYLKELLVAIVLCIRDKPAYFAYRLYSAIHDFGFHNKTVIRILIARSEIDLLTIRKRYKERYGKSLFHDIKNFSSGHYEKALLAICAGDVDDY
ncbi:annexin A10 [Sciurus carolinensis]|uniref:annexin A10 n=1 Tax=Sciurus carolinensis TaxID=30640 RepID=UPI001FB38086|nr:annexin A10 [Sciurus carolinensis]